MIITRTAKIEALSSHLLDGFLQLREKYELLEPMLFDQAVVDARGSGSSARGFNTLKHTLFIGCVQDIVKLATDNDKRAPSIANIVKALADVPIRKELLEKFVLWEIPSIEPEIDPLIIEAIKRIDQREQAQRRAQFDEIYAELISLWSALSATHALQAFRDVRDKVSAHTEIRQVADTYVSIDIGTLGIKWGDIRTTIQTMERLVEISGLLVRNSSFAWDSLDSQLKRSSKGFWLVAVS